jgi:RNA polymerase sigma-70 factor (ECF subfamily)
LTRDGYDSFFRERFSRTVVLLIAMGASRADAEDAAQEAMCQAWQHWDSIREPVAWVRTVAIRHFWRQAWTRQRTVALDSSVPEPACYLDLDVFEEEQQRVLRMLRSLPSGQRAVAALHYDELTCEEIAELLAKPAATVRSQLRHARKALKEMMLSNAHIPPSRARCQATGMTRHDNPDFDALDAYVREQLSRAAETYASWVDVDARLKAVLDVDSSQQDNDATAAES